MKERKCYICGKKATEKTRYYKKSDKFLDEGILHLCKKHFDFVILIKISKGKRHIEESDLKWLKEELE